MSELGSTQAPWTRFRRELRARELRPFAAHGLFPGAVYVAGCQRSGSTLMAQMLMDSGAFVHHEKGRTMELNSALLLSGLVAPAGEGRHLFHSAYLSAEVDEYTRLDAGSRIIWMIRRSESVVYSMLYNWSPRALNYLFAACGQPRLSAVDRRRYRWLGRLGLSRSRRASYAYAGKTGQAVWLADALPRGRLLIVDYDDLVTAAPETLARVCRHVGISGDRRLTNQVRKTSLRKADAMPQATMALVSRIARPVYDEVRALERALD